MRKILTFLCLFFFMLQAGAQVRKTVAILGDSYSTYQGFIPSGQACWYKIPAKTNMTDVCDVEQTWWWQVIKEGGYKLGKNESYSGDHL